jgi:asparagine synthase (glutamine-hydrolysing)
MCGIAGKLKLTSPGSLSPQLMAEMMEVIRHRGPDECRIYVDDRIILGHTRLSIIDLEGGCQPIHNEDRSLWITYNGEIFNYPELRKVLEGRGHTFYTATDTEVILHLFEDKGPAFLRELNGQFALAIWNSRERILFLARDRVGIRPLFYTVRDGSLIFASEIKAIFADRSVPREFDRAAIHHIFTYWSPLPGETPFREVYELKPGHFLTVLQGRIKEEKYWDIPFFPGDGQDQQPVEKWSEELESLILDAIRLRLRSDVPVGCYLSGGLDSSAIAALVARNFNGHLKTFGIRFEEESFDEGRYQNLMVSFLGTEHREMMATNEGIAQALPEVLWHCETPLLRTAPAPLFLLSQGVHEAGFKVVLTGEGADEIFGGYNIFRETKARHFLARNPDSAFRGLIFYRLYPYIFQNPKGRIFQQAFFARGLERIQDPFFSHNLRWQNTERAKMFFSREMMNFQEPGRDQKRLQILLPSSFDRWDPLSKAQYLEMKIFLSNYLLSSQGDRMAMAHSVEVRMPYLDFRLIEFMGRIPPAFRVRGMREKYLLKKAVQGHLPAEILDRPKHPYRAPIRPILFHPRILPYMDEMLSGDALKQSGLFAAGKVEKLLTKTREQNGASEVEAMALFGILSSQVIHDQFIRNYPYRKIPPVRPTLLLDNRSIENQSARQEFLLNPASGEVRVWAGRTS